MKGQKTEEQAIIKLLSDYVYSIGDENLYFGDKEDFLSVFGESMETHCGVNNAPFYAYHNGTFQSCFTWREALETAIFLSTGSCPEITTYRKGRRWVAEIETYEF